MSLRDVGYQGNAQWMVQRAAIGNRVPHAYIFNGPDGVGKEMLALGFAQMLLCGSPVDEKLEGDCAEHVGIEQLRIGCGECEACRAVTSRTHPDLHLVYRQLNREHPEPEVRKRKGLDIGVDVVRHFVINRVGLTPILGRAKVFIIREADRITTQAQNALLKTLEEPPGTTFIMLLAASVDRLLPTTLSRCQLVRFDALPTQFVRENLARLTENLPAEQVQWYALLSDGSLGRAVEFAEDGLHGLSQRLFESLAGLSEDGSGNARRSAPSAGPRITAQVKAWTEESKALGSTYRKRDPDITDTEAGRRGLKSIFKLTATWYADVLRIGSGDEDGIVNTQCRSEVQRVAQSIDPSAAIKAIKRIAAAERQLDLNVNRQLCVETLLTDLARLGRGATLSV